MGLFNDLVDTFVEVLPYAVAVAAPQFGPAAAGSAEATAAVNAANTTATAAEAANIANTANMANTINTANVANTAAVTPGLTTPNILSPGMTAGNIGAMDILGSGLGQSAAQNLAGAAGAAGSSAPLLTADAVQKAAATQGLGEGAAGISQIGNAVPGQAAISQGVGQGVYQAPNFTAQANAKAYADKMATGNAIPGMPESAPFGSVYQYPSPVTNMVPDAFNTSAGTFAGATPTEATGFGKVGDYLGKGLDKGLAWAEKNPIMAAYTAASIAGSLMGPQKMGKKEEEEDYALSKYRLSPNFKPSRPVQNPYQPRSYAAEGGIMKSYAQGGITSLASGGMGNNTGYPMGHMDMTQYATPTQMPTSAQVVNADYEQVTNPYLGTPLGMAAGGLTGKGGAGGQVYYDPQVGKYYTMGYSNNSPLGFMGIGGQSKQYIDEGPTNTSSSNIDLLERQTVTPNVYQPEFSSGAPVSNEPIASVLAAYASPEKIMQESYGLLQATAPNIASTIDSGSLSAPVASSNAPGMAKGGLPAPPIDTKEMSEEDADFTHSTPYETAAGRLKKLYKKTYVNQNPPATAPALGTLDLGLPGTKNAASGGIMGANLGGYAAGGNPRLLKGPGDGMSDNIPATIGGRQPARLADGEFVVPADVVSHLGNGSTDAGAKKLHGMMDSVRKARTGRKAQGKQIKAEKYLPK